MAGGAGPKKRGRNDPANSAKAGKVFAEFREKAELKYLNVRRRKVVLNNIGAYCASAANGPFPESEFECHYRYVASQTDGSYKIRRSRSRTTVIERAQVILTLMFGNNVNAYIGGSARDVMSETQKITHTNRTFAHSEIASSKTIIATPSPRRITPLKKYRTKGEPLGGCKT